MAPESFARIIKKGTMENQFTEYTIEHTHAHVHVAFEKPQTVLSSAVLNGGFSEATHIINLKVEKNMDGQKRVFEPSEETLSKYCDKMGWNGTAVGMMTAAESESFRMARRTEQGVEVVTLVTSGISNARRAGDRAECRDMTAAAPETGTINIIVITNAILTSAAMVEAVLNVTEAKCAALQDMGITNPETGSPATGTGTDAIAIAGGFGPVRVGFCGKHMLFGEMLASTTIEALTSSLGG
jgi:adenosylcobinamide hydrolase